MKKRFLKIIRFFLNDSFSAFLIKLAILVAVSGVLLLIVNDAVNEVFLTSFGVLLSAMAVYFLKIIFSFFEDMLKINFDTDELLKIYKKETADGQNGYKKDITLANETSRYFAYDDVMVVDDPSTTFEVEDDNKKVFQLDEFITENYDRIFVAHSNSAKVNYDTVRMDDYDPKTKTFKLSRSTYFNHLVTNRAVDFDLFEGVCLRNIYEFGPVLNPLSETKMSNHIGINALVFLSDGRLLVPQRKNDATISKNKITSSIATMLTLPNEYKNNPKSARITKEYLFYDNIVENHISDRVKLLREDIDKSKTEVRFLGFGRNIYEGGKPQMYFAVKLNNIDTEKYFIAREKYLEEQKGSEKEVVDQDKCMFAVDWETMTFKNDGMTFIAYSMNGKKERSRKIFAGYEMSYLCNIWHYQQVEKRLSSNKKMRFHEKSSM